MCFGPFVSVSKLLNPNTELGFIFQLKHLTTPFNFVFLSLAILYLSIHL